MTEDLESREEMMKVRIPSSHKSASLIRRPASQKIRFASSRKFLHVILPKKLDHRRRPRRNVVSNLPPALLAVSVKLPVIAQDLPSRYSGDLCVALSGFTGFATYHAYDIDTIPSVTAMLSTLSSGGP